MYLVKRGISLRSTACHPTGNAQVERLNEVIWRDVKTIA